MSKAALSGKILAIAIATISSVVSVQRAQAQSIFGEAEINPEAMIAIAVPLQGGDYNFLVVEQFGGKQACWAESSLNPTIVDPLLLNFEFTQDCRRSTDSNGHSMRINGEDFGRSHLLRIIDRQNELLLVATPGSRREDEIIIARSNGLADGYLKMNLLPGWEFTRRTYENKPLGHFYFSSNGSQIVTLPRPTVEELLAASEGETVIPNVPAEIPVDVSPTTPSIVIPTETLTPDTTVASQFTDIEADIYRTEIAQAVNVGFIAGFNDDTFRPTDVLTREQLVSMAIEGLQTIPNMTSTVPSQVAASPYPDVAADRWSAAKISWAQDNNIVSGYPDGTFQPTQPVTRAELLAVLRRTAEYAKSIQGQSTTLVATNSAFPFSDTEGHWAKDLAAQMSTYCNVASPYNEAGDLFFPDTASQRNYAAAATLRTLECSVQ